MRHDYLDAHLMFRSITLELTPKEAARLRDLLQEAVAARQMNFPGLTSTQELDRQDQHLERVLQKLEQALGLPVVLLLKSLDES
jgi:hypothetical protein